MVKKETVRVKAHICIGSFSRWFPIIPFPSLLRVVVFSDEQEESGGDRQVGKLTSSRNRGRSVCSCAKIMGTHSGNKQHTISSSSCMEQKTRTELINNSSLWWVLQQPEYLFNMYILFIRLSVCAPSNWFNRNKIFILVFLYLLRRHHCNRCRVTGIIGGEWRVQLLPAIPLHCCLGMIHGIVVMMAARTRTTERTNLSLHLFTVHFVALPVCSSSYVEFPLIAIQSGHVCVGVQRCGWVC